jgi:hypothetical protein
VKGSPSLVFRANESCGGGRRAAPFVLLSLLTLLLSASPLGAFDPYFSSHLDISLSELQAALTKVHGPVTFGPRPGSTQGTQEARLPDNAGMVQAAGSAGNLAVIILWLPVDASGKLVGANARQYLEAFLQLLTDEKGPFARWVEQVLEQGVAEKSGKPYLESRLVEERQFKAMYMPTLTPPMLSLTVEASGQSSSR